jgi:hypothetical protein
MTRTAQTAISATHAVNMLLFLTAMALSALPLLLSLSISMAVLIRYEASVSV